MVKIKIANKLGTRLTIAFVCIAFLTVALAGALINYSLNVQFRRYISNNEDIRNRRIVEALVDVYKTTGGWDSLKWEAPHIEMMTGVRIRLVDSLGRTVFDSRESCPMTPGMMENAMMGREEQTGATAAIPIRIGPKKAGTAYITTLGKQGFWSKQDLIFRSTINSSIVLAGLVAGLAALLFSLVLSARITRPVASVTSAVQRMGAGDLNQRVKIDSHDELGILGHAFNEMAAHLQKLESLREKLTADVAHELRTPITTIRSYIEAFKDGMMPPDRERLDLVHEEILRLVQLVEDLQDLSIVESGGFHIRREQVDLRTTVETSVQRLQHLFDEKKIELNLNMPQSPVVVEVDSNAMERVFYNILSNAWKYTEPDGRVDVNVEKRGNKALVIIRDTGIGIPETDLPYVFERFYRADHSRARETGGTGIGLTIARELVEAHDGRIEVRSKVGKGTKFSIYI